ncbi:MAG: HD domain-containing protein [Actinobacteria bacterium]|nr:HD domain-containing protein [Actinomycetota bacterium]
MLQVQRARELAIAAHAGQVDKNGSPYHLHPEAVAAAFDPDTEPVECAAAWLHDVLEDTAVDADGMREQGIQDPVIAVVELLTRHRDQPDADYYAQIRADPTARRVKLADIAHNTDPDRVAQLDEPTRRRLAAKYAKARAALGVDDPHAPGVVDHGRHD